MSHPPPPPLPPLPCSSSTFSVSPFHFLPFSLFLLPLSSPSSPFLSPSHLPYLLPLFAFHSLSFSFPLDSSPLPIVTRVTEITRLVTQMLKNDWSLASHLQPITSQYLFIVQKYIGIIVLIVGWSQCGHVLCACCTHINCSRP